MIFNRLNPLTRNVFQKLNPWGLSTSINLYGCNPVSISSKPFISIFAKRLCDNINMNAFGEPTVIYFGSDKFKGYSLVQLIETSSITGHFGDSDKVAYIDIFSCSYYDPEEATAFCKDYFSADMTNYTTVLRH